MVFVKKVCMQKMLKVAFNKINKKAKTKNTKKAKVKKATAKTNADRSWFYYRRMVAFEGES